MVVITLTPYRGNHARSFPYAGYLGLTPVVLQGTVRTALEEDRKPIRASSVQVRIRCYEAETGKTPVRRGSNGSNGTSSHMNILFDLTQDIWRAPFGNEFGDVGDLVRPFRLVIPKDAPGVSTTTFKHYKTWWQIEAVIHHKPSALHGSRKLISHPIPLIRFSSPKPSSAYPALEWASSSSSSSKLAGLKYSIKSDADSLAVGPAEDLKFSLILNRCPETNFSVKKVQICLDRHFTINSQESRIPLDECSNIPNKEISKLSGSTTGGTTSTLNVLSLELDEPNFDLEHRLIGCTPKSKSMYRYSVGETMSTKIAQIYYTITIKFILRHRSGQTEQIQLQPKPIQILASSKLEREKALQHAGKALAVAEAELRLFSTVSPAISSLGTRRGSHFVLTVDTKSTHGNPAAGPPLASPSASLGSKRSCTTP